MKRILFLALFLSQIVPASAQQVSTPISRAPLDLKAYLGELERWSAAARTLKDHPEEATALRKELPQAWSIRMGEQHFEVSTQWVDSILDSIGNNPRSAGINSRQMVARLNAMRAEAVALARPAELQPGTARSKLDEVLRRSEFRGVHGPTWFDRLRERVSFWLAKFLEKLLVSLQGHPMGTKVLLWAMLIVAGLAFLVWLVRLLLYRPISPGLDLSGAIPAPSTWRDLLRDAVASAGRGNYRDAIRLAYWAGVYRLEELGMWQVDRTRTHREYLRLLPESYPSRGAVSAITSRFEQIWYGEQAASSEDFQFASVQLEKLGCVFPSNPTIVKS